MFYGRTKVRIHHFEQHTSSVVHRLIIALCKTFPKEIRRESIAPFVEQTKRVAIRNQALHHLHSGFRVHIGSWQCRGHNLSVCLAFNLPRNFLRRAIKSQGQREIQAWIVTRTIVNGGVWVKVECGCTCTTRHQRIASRCHNLNGRLQSNAVDSVRHNVGCARKHTCPNV